MTSASSIVEAVIVVGGETRGLTDSAVDVDHDAAGATDEVMVIVADSILVARRRSRGLDSAGQPPADQRSQGVVHRLPGNRSDAPSHVVGELVRGGMRVGRHRPQHGEPLGGDLQPVPPQEPLGVLVHRPRVTLILDSVKYQALSGIVGDELPSLSVRVRLRQSRQAASGERARI